MFNSEQLQEKWNPVLDCDGLDNIKDTYKKAVTAVLLENQEKFLKEEAGILTEAAPTMSAGTGGFTAGSTATGPVAGFDPVLISLIRRSMPKLIAYDIAGVQPMTGPTGLIFAMRSRYGTNRTAGTEAFFNEADTEFSAENAASDLGRTAQAGSNPGLLNDSGTYNTSDGMPTGEAEALGDAAGNQFAEMNFSIEKVTVTAKSRALKAEYSLELAQDLKAVHGLDAESELANILSTEVLAEINREVVRTVYKVARPGAQNNTATAGIFDLDVDSNGRWSVEKFKGLLFQIERDMNAIGHETRRGKGNILICSADVASALSMAGVLDYTPALQGNSNLLPDDNSSTLAGTLNGRIKVYVDPYSANVSDRHFYVGGYKGSSAYDAGLFYCPYVPLQMVRAVGQDTFQPKIGFKTRYGLVANPFAEGTTQGGGDLDPNKNRYYRRVLVDNLM
tara:strand:- start:583 stop:1929 length:1347 start_codon:yes stop_codon:yes gene_type:complete